MSKIDVVYLWYPAEWESLAYSINSVKRHFKNLGIIWILNDVKPDLACDYNFFKVGNIGAYTDDRMIHKLKTFITQTDIEEFLCMADDIYFMDDVSLEELKEPIALQDMRDKTQPSILFTEFEKLSWQTIYKLKGLECPIWNYATHLPHYVESRKFLEACEILGDSFQIFTGYHNCHFKARPRTLDELNWRAGFYNACNKFVMHKKLQNKRFVNHDDYGISDDLKEYIVSQYG